MVSGSKAREPSESTRARRCPSWCLLPADHDPDDARDGGRVHSVPGLPATVWLSYADDAGWYAEVCQEDAYVGATAAAVAGKLRALADDLVKAGEWLEAQA